MFMLLYFNMNNVLCNGSCIGSCNSTTPVKAVRMVFGNVQWFKAVDYADLLRLLLQYSGQKIRLMGANTGTGKHLIPCLFFIF